MSEDYQRIEVITGVARGRHWSTEAKLRIIEESFEPGETVSSVARRSAQSSLPAAPSVERGRRGSRGFGRPIVGSSEVRRLEERVRELERDLLPLTIRTLLLRQACRNANRSLSDHNFVIISFFA